MTEEQEKYFQELLEKKTDGMVREAIEEMNAKFNLGMTADGVEASVNKVQVDKDIYSDGSMEDVMNKISSKGGVSDENTSLFVKSLTGLAIASGVKPKDLAKAFFNKKAIVKHQKQTADELAKLISHRIKSEELGETRMDKIINKLFGI